MGGQPAVQMTDQAGVLNQVVFALLAVLEGGDGSLKSKGPELATQQDHRLLPQPD